jgi:hypothetical protein
VEIINTIFRLGVILAIFGFIWSLVQLAVLLVSGGQRLGIWQHYLLLLIQNLFLVQVTFLFCYETDSALSLSQNSIAITTIILVIYFVSKLQNRQQRKTMISFMRNNQIANTGNTTFDIRAEIGLVVLGLAYFISCIFFPFMAENKLSFWFKDAIINIEDTPIFGFIFKIVGFFFLLSIFSKIFQSIVMIVAPKQFQKQHDNSHQGRKDDDYDDFEDITEK